MDWHPLLLAALPALVGALVPQIRDAVLGWFAHKWRTRPSAQRREIIQVVEQFGHRLTAHLDAEDIANAAVVAAAEADAGERTIRQDEIDAEFRAVDSRFERVEARLDQVHEQVARLAGNIEVLIGQRR